MADKIELTIESYLSTIPNSSLLDDRLKNSVHIAKIAKSITDWGTVLPYLSGLNDKDKEAIQHDCTTLEQQKIGLLNKWRERNGPHATYRKLAQSLFDAEKIDALQVLCELLGEPRNSQQPEKKQQSGPGASPVDYPPPGNLAMSGKTTPQYKSVNTSQSTIISAFKCNPSAFKTLKQKFKEKSWLALADDKDEEGLVILVLNRIELDVGDFNKLNDMLKGIEGMDLIVKQLKAAESAAGQN